LRTPIAFHPDELAKAMKEVAESSSFAGQTEYLIALSQHSYLKGLTPKGVSTTWIKQRITESALEIPVAQGKRGCRDKGVKALAKARAQKGRKPKIFSANWADNLRNYWVFANAQTLINRVIGGSKSAALKAKCLECYSGDRKGIRECSSYSCPLWGFRPYQRGDDDTDGDAEGIADQGRTE
jgi:hypothetical protein